MFAAAVLPRLLRNNVLGHTTKAPPVGFELATNGIQFYAIANSRHKPAHLRPGRQLDSHKNNGIEALIVGICTSCLVLDAV